MQKYKNNSKFLFQPSRSICGTQLEIFKLATKKKMA